MLSCVYPSRGLGSTPGNGGVFQEIFPWPITLYQPVLTQRGRKWLNLPSMAPHNLWPSRRKAEVQPWTDDSSKIEIGVSSWHEAVGRLNGG